jgi:hypothetical protein
MDVPFEPDNASDHDDESAVPEKGVIAANLGHRLRLTLSTQLPVGNTSQAVNLCRKARVLGNHFVGFC